MKSKRNAPNEVRLRTDRFERVERLAVFEIANFVLMAHLKLQGVFALRPEEFQVFCLIALATVQRHVRAARVGSDLVDKTPLPAELAGWISRRRISETLGIPLETVRRHVASLISRSLVVERGRGRISTPGGTLARIAEDGTDLFLARQHTRVSNALLRMNVLAFGPAPKNACHPQD